MPRVDIELASPELVQVARDAREAQVKFARVNPAQFNEFVLRDEETGAPVRNAPFHEEIHDILNEYAKVVFWAHVESGKTQGFTIGRAMWELGHNPELRIVVCMATHGKAVKVVNAIAGYVERSQELHEVFPHMVPGTPWKPLSGMITVARDGHVRDPSIQGTGFRGDIVGNRIDLLIFDDILRWENVLTQAQREKVIAWEKASCAGRMTGRSRTWAPGTAWHEKDAMHDFARRAGWYAARFPVQKPDGSSNWPGRWPPERIAAARIELGPLEAARQLDCKARDEASTKCKEEWLLRCIAEGAGLALVSGLAVKDHPEGAFTVTGVDVAAKKKRVGALTVLITMLIYRNGDHQMLDIQRGNWSGPEIRDRVIATQQRYDSVVFVESTGMQLWMLEMIGELAAIPVWPFATGVNKWHPAYGVESLFAMFASGKWILPNPDSVVACDDIEDEDVLAFLNASRAYHPSEHTPDELMAAWFAKEGGRALRAVLQEDAEDEASSDEPSPAPPPAEGPAEPAPKEEAAPTDVAAFREWIETQDKTVR